MSTDEERMVWEIYARGLAPSREKAWELVEQDRKGAEQLLQAVRSGEIASIEEWGSGDLGTAA